MKNVRQQDTTTEIQITRAQSEDILSARINQKTDFVYNAKTGELKIGEETFVTDAGIRDFSLLFDDVILEVTADCGTITVYSNCLKLQKNFAWKRAVERRYRFSGRKYGNLKGCGKGDRAYRKHCFPCAE